MKYPVDGLSKDGNCGVTALACLAETTVAEMFTHVQNKYGRRGNWKGSMYLNQLLETFAEFGVVLEEVYWKREGYSTPTLKTLVEKHLGSGTYVVFTTNHFQVVHNRVVYDQSGGKKAAEHWGARKHVKGVWRVK